LDHHETMKIARLPSLVSFRLAAASLLMLTATACGSAPPAAPSASADPAPAGKAEQLWQQIQAANADTSCDTSSQCHTIGTGSKACGGPERYLAWSSKHGDGAALKALVEQHSAVRRADDERAQMMSTCSMVSDPGASCRAGRCTLNPAALGGVQPNQQ
jgi:hypothetical protein